MRSGRGSTSKKMVATCDFIWMLYAASSFRPQSLPDLAERIISSGFMSAGVVCSSFDRCEETTRGKEKGQFKTLSNNRVPTQLAQPHSPLG